MTNKISNVLAVLAVGGLMFVGSAAAQSATDNTSGAGPGVHDAGHPRVNQVNGREAHQQKRIGNGVANGTLTSKQATHLEKRETAVQNPRRRIWLRTMDSTRAERDNANRTPEHQRDKPWSKQQRLWC
jgi:hypothetical protein